jgi:hypothetical protein
MVRKTTAERLAHAERKVEQAKARLSAIRARSSKQDRRIRARRLIVLGAIIEAQLSRKDIATWVLERLSEGTFRESDREPLESIALQALEAMPKMRDGKDWPALKFSESSVKDTEDEEA